MINAEEELKILVDIMLKDKLKLESVNALKAHDQKLVDVLRFLVSLIDKKELQLPAGKMTEADEIAVLRKELKNKEESREMFAKAGRGDLVVCKEKGGKVAATATTPKPTKKPTVSKAPTINCNGTIPDYNSDGIVNSLDRVNCLQSQR